MSAPVQETDTLENPLGCAPSMASESPPAEPERIVLTRSPPMAPGIGGPNIPLPPPRPFEGDLAVKEMRRRLSLRPELVPGPPIRPARAQQAAWISSLPIMLTLAAFVGICLMVIVLPDRQRAMGGMQALLTSIPPLLAGSARVEPPAAPQRRVVANQRGLANEPLPLGVSLSGQSGSEIVVLGGLAAGTRLSLGAPLGSTGWRLPGRELGKALAVAPKDFVGTMDTVIDVRSASDRLMDSQIVRLEWIPKQPVRHAKEKLREEARLVMAATPRSLDPDEVEMLVRRGREFLNMGDIAAARLVLGRAATAGNAQAAFVFGATFDPEVLADLGVLGFAPDVAKAREWYQRATALGSTEAPRRMERLAARR